jgi:hypothetical protein
MIANRLVGANGYAPVVAAVYNVANSAGSGAGTAVTISMSFTDQYGVGGLPGDATTGRYSVLVTPNQNALDYVTAKTSSGFNVVLTPSPATNTLAAGVFDVLVHG